MKISISILPKNLKLDVIPKAQFCSPKGFYQKYTNTLLLGYWQKQYSATLHFLSTCKCSISLSPKSSPFEPSEKLEKKQVITFVNVQVTLGLHFLSNHEIKMYNFSVYFLSHSFKLSPPFCSSRIFKPNVLTMTFLKSSEIITQKEYKMFVFSNYLLPTA